ncbi:MAG: DUF5985 family protein [Pseudomonadota bacterium]|nr:DUF5985 family protein [Pseudomonadota bacterium]
MALLVYALCLITAISCAGLLLRGFARTRSPLLLSAGLCFVGLAANEALVLVDLYVIPDTSLLIARRLAGLAAVALMLVGLIFYTQEPSP